MEAFRRWVWIFSGIAHCTAVGSSNKMHVKVEQLYQNTTDVSDAKYNAV